MPPTKWTPDSVNPPSPSTTKTPDPVLEHIQCAAEAESAAISTPSVERPLSPSFLALLHLHWQATADKLQKQSTWEMTHQVKRTAFKVKTLVFMLGGVSTNPQNLISSCWQMLWTEVFTATCIMCWVVTIAVTMPCSVQWGSGLWSMLRNVWSLRRGWQIS